MAGRYKHIIWDWNGTLFDDAALCVTILNRMLAERGLPRTTLERYRESFTFPVRTYYQLVGFDLSRESFETLGYEYISAYEAERYTCGLQPDALSVLAHVTASGSSQSLLSAYAQETLIALVRALGLDHFFEHLVGLDNIYAHGKLELGRGLIAVLPYSPDRILLIGDTLHDAEVAKVMGTACVLVSHGHQARDRLRQCGALVVDSLQEVYGLI